MPLEGEARPGYFDGVATVVTKLLLTALPDVAYWGQKDGQQVAVVRRLVADLGIPVQLRVVPTVREPDGLAMSSRNFHLSPQQRRAVPVIYRALCRAKELWEGGEVRSETLRSEVWRVLDEEPLVEGIDYVSVADVETLEELDAVLGLTMVSVAVRMGKVRLIDNVVLGEI